MKQILAVTLTLAMLLAVLTGCMAPQDNNSSQNLKDSPNSKISQNSLIIEETIKTLLLHHYPRDMNIH